MDSRTSHNSTFLFTFVIIVRLYLSLCLALWGANCRSSTKPEKSWTQSYSTAAKVECKTVGICIAVWTSASFAKKASMKSISIVKPTQNFTNIYRKVVLRPSPHLHSNCSTLCWGLREKGSKQIEIATIFMLKSSSQNLPGNDICGLPQTSAHETDNRINNFISTVSFETFEPKNQ